MSKISSLNNSIIHLFVILEVVVFLGAVEHLYEETNYVSGGR